MDTQKLASIRISSGERRRSGGPFWFVVAGVAVITLVALYFARPKTEQPRLMTLMGGKPIAAEPSAPPRSAATPAAAPAPARGETLLTVSGYIVNRERIELSPRFQGQVTWIGVKKGDRVARNQVVVTLDDAEQQARLLEAQGKLAGAKAALERAELNFRRAQRLGETRVVSKEIEDEARLQVASMQADVQQAEGMLAYARTQLDWTVIRAPIDGVILEKLVDSGELVTPQSFGGTRGPSTALLALADPLDLQVEIDVNEADLPKIHLGQKCRISPEAYPDKTYDGYVAERAPEASRQKGTLQIKVQIANPDEFLTPELSAKVEFSK